LRCIGADRVDIEEMLKSTEWFRVFFEESNTVPAKAIDIGLLRARQFCFHRDLKVHHFVNKKAVEWGVDESEAWEILRTDPLNAINQFDLSLDDAMPGMNLIKCTANPDGNNHIWQRFVGIPYPEQGYSREWTKKNIGVREFAYDYESRHEINVPLLAGNLVQDEDGNRGYVKSLSSYALDAVADVTLIGGRVVSGTKLSLILQVYTRPSHNEENLSRSVPNQQAALLTSKDIRLATFGGKMDTRSGLVFPTFDPRYVKDGGHVLPRPDDGVPSGHIGIGGLDQGGGHATSAVLGFITKGAPTRIVFFDEYVKSGQSAKDTAYELKDMIPYQLNSMRWGADPSMWNSKYVESTTYTHAQKYFQAGLDLVLASKGDAAYDDVLDWLSVYDSWIERKPMPRFFVWDNCTQIIEAMQQLTWEDVRHSRHKWIVDLGDAIKYAVSIINKNDSVSGSNVPEIRSKLVYTNEFA
jgi:hypothetical protein